MAASDLQVTATRGRVPPDVVPTVGEDSISAAQGASGRSSDALKYSICSPAAGEQILYKGCFGDGNVPFLSFHFHTGIETIVCTVSALASRGAQRERACGRFRLHGALKKRALQGAMSSLSY